MKFIWFFVKTNTQLSHIITITNLMIHIYQYTISKKKTIIIILTEYARPTCTTAAVPFLCQYILPLCEKPAGNQAVVLPTREKCLEIKESSCDFEWLFIANSKFGNLVPNCSALPGKYKIGMYIMHICIFCYICRKCFCKDRKFYMCRYVFQ